ncbi:vacuolar protein sorting-associated protein 13A-like [Stylophora pistillata]|uniref:vacuolar protein sorting-associated protein 13A-like n=1 Tax=Stylophora pistillata TaxID=50429 RepID=UPI000C048740|nr:vacuolar protein sorting-associated protein 13A-like [Stylophora pistillata]
MVFESYIVDLLNKFAGQYLENLDTSQLRLGIWGGDVLLENLILKESALDDLDLPVKVLRGHLGKLVLKIPWKNLYSKPFVAQVDGLYLLVRPNTDVKYNAEKEEKAKQERKQRQLEAVELAQQIEEEKKKQNGQQKDEKSDSFVEKLAMQIVKNLQVSVRNIHIRYEDSVTNPTAPFSIGATLENLSAESTDENWVPSIVGESVKIVHKLVKLDSLALYWNTKDDIGKLPTQEDWVNQAKGGIAIRRTKHFSPPDFKYILQPISATTKVKMNMKPGSDLSIPKIFLSLVLEEISLVLMRKQYHDMIELLESFDRMTTNSVYRKYKPNVPLLGHAAQWWSYAITSILEEDVRRRLRNWSWPHIKEHRDLCRRYKNLYKKKLLEDNASDSLSKELEALESKLDVLNITICRRQAAYEEAVALMKKKKKAEEKKSGRWFSGFWGSGKKRKKEEDKPEILTEDQKKEELEKLYSAIGYSEGETITAFPKEYVENKVVVILKQISVALRDDAAPKSVHVAKLSFQDLYAELFQRPSAEAIKLSAKVDQMKMFGSADVVDGKMPLMLTSQDDKLESHLALFNASFETNPLDGKCDQKAKVTAQPVKLVYDANTVDHIVTFFQPPKDVLLQELSAEAYSRLEDLKSVSKASLFYAIEHHKITDVDVDVKSPFIVIPEGGTLKKSGNVLVIDLGHVKITSDPEQERIVSTKDLSVEDLESKCYDKFDFKLKDLQILIAKAGEDWQAARKKVNSEMHILDPMGIDMRLHKALNPDDIRLAQIKLSGTLPTVKVHVTDEKLLQVIKLATSIPIPGGKGASDQTDNKPMDILGENPRYTTARAHDDVSQLGVLEGGRGERVDGAEEMEEMFTTPPETLTGVSNLEQAKLEEKEALAKQVKVSLQFEIEEISVDVDTVDSGGKSKPCLALYVKGLGTTVVMHPWDLSASASLSSLVVAEMIHGPGGGPLYLVQTPVGAELLSVKFVMVESEHPEYSSKFKSTKQSVAVEFSSLQVKLHQEALLNIIDVAFKMVPPSEETPALPVVSADSAKTEDQDENKTSEMVTTKGTKKKDSKDEIQIEVTAKLSGIDVTVTSVEGDLTHVIIGDLSASCVVRDSRTDVIASMKTLSVMDSTPGAFYPKIVSIVNQEVFSLQVIAYNGATAGVKFRDMEAVDLKFQMGISCIRVIFLNKFVMKLLDFLNKFQRAKDAMEYARKTAAQSASATIQSLQTQSLRISLNVSIQAPLVIIPVSSTSRDALVANLGQLNVSNTFNLAHGGKDPEGSDAVVLDKMAVELSSVKLLRAVMTDGETIGATQLVLEPANLTVLVARSLSPWYHDVPNIDVEGKLHAVTLCAGEDDVRTILGILFKNLSEGVAPHSEDITPIAQDIVDAAGVASQSLSVAEPASSDVVWDFVRFSFEIEEVSAAVFLKEKEKPNGTTSSRNAECCLGQLSLAHVKASGSIKSNSAIYASVTLESCILDDKRPQSEEGVSRMIEKFTGGSSDVENMIDIQFQQTAAQDKTIEMAIQSFNVVVNLEFLLVLSNVFMSALATEESDSSLSPASQHLSQGVPVTHPSVTVATTDEESPQINVQISIKDPEIILLADGRDKNTNALFLKSTIDFRFIQAFGQQKMSGSVSDVVITSAAFDKERRASTKSRVLQLSHISFVSSVPEGSSMHLDVSTAMAYIHVSPPTIRTLTACLMSLAPAKKEEDEKKATDSAVDLWSEKPITTKDRWYLFPVPKDQLVPGRRVLARSFNNIKFYDRGYIYMATDHMIGVHFDGGLPWGYDPNDITAMVVDKNPDPKALVVGTRVVAKRSKVSSHVEGKVKERKEEDGKESYLIDFWDGIEQWDTLDQIRILTTSKPGVPKGQIEVSSIVFVRFKDDMYRRSFVSSKTHRKLVIRLIGEVMTLSVDANDSAAVVPDVIPDPAHLTVGRTVIATVDMVFWEAGNIVQIRTLDDSGQDIYRVRFINGGDAWIFNSNNIRILMTRKPKVPEGILDVGTVVWAHTSKIRYYKGFVAYKGTKLHVDLYDGDKFVYEMKDASHRVIPDVPPKAADIKPGTRVIAKFKNKPRYYSSTVMEVDASDPNEPKYHVKLDDGDETWDSLYHLRLLPKEVQVGGEEKPPDHVNASGAGYHKTEVLLFEMEGFDIKLEGLFGGQVIPLLSVDGSIQGEVKNWSSALSVHAGVGVIGNYFNESVSEWEPLIEPVEDEHSNYRHWEVNFDISLANGGGGSSSLDDNSEAAMTLAVKSKDELQLTVTKTCLDIFTKLGAAFKEAVALEGTGVLAIEDVPPYQIWNELGMEVKLRPGKQLMVASGVDQDGMVTMLPGQSVSLRFAKGIHKRASRYERVNSTSGGGGPSIGVEVQGYHEMKPVSIKQARVILQNVIPKKLIERIILLPEMSTINEMVLITDLDPDQLLSDLIVSVVIQVETGDGQKIVTIRSPLQVNNHFPIPMDLLCKKEDQLSCVATIQPDGVFSVPLILAHKAALYLRPAGFGYGASSTPLLWNKLASQGQSSFQCPPPGGEGPPFHIEVDCEQVSYSAVHGSLEHAPNFVLHIYPPAVLHNYLPYNIHYWTLDMPVVELKGGENWPLFSVSLHRKVNLYIKTGSYQGSLWRGQVELFKGMDELTPFTLEPTEAAAYGKHLRLGVFATFDGTMNITLYSPYWMVNKTGLYLEYKAPDSETVIPHPVSLTEPVMFSCRGKGEAFVRLAASDWSNKFSLDTAGSGGALKITKDGKLYEIGMQTTLSYFSLTKIVEFTPFNLINNHTEYPVSLTDSRGPDATWTKVQPGECIPFWPNSCPSKNLAIRVGDSEELSSSFNFEPDITLLLRMNGKVGAVCADMRTKDSAAITTITPYFAGAATVRLENCTQLEICYKQEGCKEHCLHANQSVLFTWDEPTASREFVWCVKGSENRIITKLSQTMFDRFEHDGKAFHYSTFLDGLQRVLLIIDDFTLAYRAQVELKERPSLCITMALQGVGMSLVNNEKSIEVAYIGIKPSDIIWEEQKKKGRWKALKLRLCNELEVGWSKLQRDKAVVDTPNYIYKSGDLEVDFQQMEIVRPTRQHIRRTFSPGISLEYTSSPNELTLSTKINSVQIDSQIPSATFQTVLFPVPPPKSIAADSEPKPYIELSLVTKQEEHTHVNEIKYFKVLIQEMDLKVDMAFLMALLGLISFDTTDRSQEASQYALDKKRVHDKLGEAFAVQAALSTDRNFFDFFHLSPLKIHVSFSQLGGGAEAEKAQAAIGGSFVSLLLKSVGVAVTEVQDVEFKLAYFEIRGKVYTQQQLIDVAVKHYSSQALKQMYVLVLGLDVLGNPFALITGLKEGAKDFFYEPYQGLIQGPGEFAEGLMIGAKSLLGHTVGGAAGAVSRITGTLGKGIAALTMDDKYKQERRQAMGKKPVNVKEGLTRGGKGLLDGVLGGVTGIVTKPMEGAKSGGTAGFFKGLGKGVVGVVARPAGGLVDFASSTLEGIKGSASSGSGIGRLRPPRCFYADKVIKPYNRHEAEGNAVLQETKKTRAVLADDTYFCHSRLNIKKVLLITNKHIIVAGKTEVFEAWQIDWMCGFQELTAEPTTDGERLVLKVLDKAKAKGIFKRQSADTRVLTPSPEVAQWLVGKIKEARS